MFQPVAKWPLLLDGGLATELQARGHDLSSPLWSAQMLIEDTAAIVAVHRSYLDAGAQCLISASYQASRRGFAEFGLGPDRADALIVESVRLAREAASSYATATGAPSAMVAASCGPFGAVLHDGSEYTGHYPVTDDELMAFHAERLPVLLSSGADLLACETLPSLREARILARLLADAPIPTWVSFCCRDEGHLSEGTPIENAVALFTPVDPVFAVGVNCTAPRCVRPLIDRIAQAAPAKRIVVYPNSGEHYCVTDGSWAGENDAEQFAELALGWIDAGASLVGGCCRVGPAHIAALASAID